MSTVTKPSQEELRRAQAALDAVNVAYEYFSPLPTPAVRETAEYYEYVKAA